MAGLVWSSVQYRCVHGEQVVNVAFAKEPCKPTHQQQVSKLILVLT